MKPTSAIMTGFAALTLVANVCAAPLPTLDQILDGVPTSWDYPKYSNYDLPSGDDYTPSYGWLQLQDPGEPAASFALRFEIAGNRDDNEFGLYNLEDPSETMTVFPGPWNEGDASVVVEFDVNAGTAWIQGDKANTEASLGTSFGLFLRNPDENLMFYSQSELNTGNGVQAVLYGASWDNPTEEITIQRRPGTPNYTPESFSYDVVAAFEDLPVAIRSDGDYNDMLVGIDQVMIPEPGVLSLFGIGLLSMIGFGWIRRKKETGN